MGYRIGLVFLFVCSLGFTSPIPGRTPVFVFMGGFNSCGSADEEAQPRPDTMRMFPSVKKLLDQLKEKFGVQPHWVASCYGPGQQLLTDSEEIDLRILSSTSAMQVVPTHGVLIRTIPRLVDVIQSELTAAQTRAVYLIGHSYGGWTAMQTVLSLNPEVRVMGLMTLDPISPIHCNPEAIFEEVIPAVEGCQRAPSDITGAQRRSIKNRTSVWSHFYQTQFHRLHSSAYEEPHFVKHVRYENRSPIYNNQHIYLENDERVWKNLLDQMSNYYEQFAGRN